MSRSTFVRVPGALAAFLFLASCGEQIAPTQPSKADKIVAVAADTVSVIHLTVHGPVTISGGGTYSDTVTVVDTVRYIMDGERMTVIHIYPSRCSSLPDSTCVFEYDLISPSTVKAIYVITTSYYDLRAFGETAWDESSANGSAYKGAYIPFDEFYRITVFRTRPTATVVQGALRIYDPADRTRGDRIVLILKTGD